jgi:hypothetical protein
MTEKKTEADGSMSPAEVATMKEIVTRAEVNLQRMRESVRRTLGLSSEAMLTIEMTAEAVDRICRAAGATVPGLPLLARDLDLPQSGER